MTDRPNQAITFRMVITHAVVIGVIAAILGWLGQFVYLTRGEGAVIERNLAITMENLRQVADVLREVKDELKEMRRERTAK